MLDQNEIPPCRPTPAGSSESSPASGEGLSDLVTVARYLGNKGNDLKNPQ